MAVLHLLAGCRKHLPLCATTRMMSTHDIPQLLASLLYMQPWKTQQTGDVYVFEDSEWQRRTPKDPPLSRTECQMWATLQTLLFDVDCITMYEINNARKNVLLKLCGRLNEAALAQIPSLEHLARWLAALPLTQPQQPHPPPLITTLPQVSNFPYPPIYKYFCSFSLHGYSFMGTLLYMGNKLLMFTLYA